MRHFFCQELHFGRVNVNGATVPFEALEGNQAVIALDDQVPADVIFIQGLQSLVGTASIVRITQEEYDLKKNEYPSVASKPPSKKETLQILPTSAPGLPRKDAAAAVKPAAAPIQQKPAPTVIKMPAESSKDLLDTAFRPPTGRASQAAPAVAKASP